MHRFPLRMAALAALVLLDSPALAERYTLPLFVTSTTAGATQGVLRILNDTGESGSVEIHAIDDAGTPFGPATFTLNAWTAVEFDASELASGNAMKGLSTGIGSLSGDVRLVIETELRIVPSAYVRAADGTLSAMHDTVRAGVAAGGGGGYRYLVPIFNSASEVTQVSRLRLINPGDRIVTITIDGRDDTGAAATGGTVQLTLPAGGAETLTAQQLEAGDTALMGQTGRAGQTGQAGLTGRLGAGVGRWRLSVSSDRSIQVVNVVSATAGYMNNLSTTAVPAPAPVDHEAFNEHFGASGIEYRTGSDRFTFTAPAADRFTEMGESGGVAFTNMGSYRYEAVRPDAGIVTLVYDNGDVCRANLYFESQADGRFASRCTGSDSPDGFWSGGSWSRVDSDGTMPEDPSGMGQDSDCYPGLIVRKGERCTYPGTADEFTINERGRGRFLTFLAGIRINVSNETINGRVYDFRASHQGDGVWRIDRVAGRTEAPSFGAAANPGPQTYMAGTAIDALTLPEATGGNGRLTYGLSPDVPGLSFDTGMRQLAGTPSTAGIYDMTYTVTDTDGDTDTLGFTITVEGADDGEDEGGGDGDTGGGTSAAVSVENASCRGTRTDASTVRVEMGGTVRAHRAVSSVRVIGYVSGLLLGADFLGNIPAGGTRNFFISGDISTTSNRISCNAEIHFLLAAPLRGADSVSIDFGARL